MVALNIYSYFSIKKEVGKEQSQKTKWVDVKDNQSNKNRI